ncbi:hypothetical protein PHJA_002214000 [Phtheirospermum japonicum]|uniref:Stigma-specific Stig1 family protein n=1 Tax=Phtheirospermum japonicum TaxID=374723 RepID=A0A830CLL4_9LAMI|nr:hypothetical protein PHJA_002214000 [Phtheirospermum japonicum]
MGCHRRPWICNQGGDSPPTRRLCCRNRCIEVDSDPNNCGFCGVRCPFTWQCCLGNCRNINSDPLHCGACEIKCQSPEICVYGLCGYADEPPSSDPCPPWRHHRHHRPCPWPPRPFPPKRGGGWLGPPPVG